MSALSIEVSVVLTISVPAFGWLIVELLHREGRKLATISLLFALATLLLASYNLLIYFSGEATSETFTLVSFQNMKIVSFLVDEISVVISFLVVLVGFLILMFSTGYMSPKNKEHPIEEGYAWFYAMMLVFMASMVGVIFSYSLVTMAMFYELTGLCSCTLIGFYHEKEKPIYSAQKALYLTHIGGLFLFLAVAVLYMSAGSVTFGSLKLLNPFMRTVVVLLITVACWAKSAQIPFYTWLPDAMVAPTPVSAYLHAAAMVKVGPYLLFRTVQYAAPVRPEASLVIGIMAIVTMIYALIMYLPQLDMKRLLAYSTIAQLSYMFLALAFASAGSLDGLRSAMFHVWNHAYAKALFFLTAGALSYATGTRFLNSYRGLAEKSKLLALSFTVAALAISGVPPLNCFYSKFSIFVAGFSTGALWTDVLTIIAIGESVCCFVVLLHWTTRCVYGRPSARVKDMLPLPTGIKVALAVLIVMCFVSAYLFFPIMEQITFRG